MDIPTPMAEQARQRLEQLATSLEEIRSMLDQVADEAEGQ